MTPEATNHLDENALIAGLVDPAELHEDQRRHLADCPRCRAQIEALSGDLEKMARVAEILSPKPAGPIRAPWESPRRAARTPFARRFAIGLALATVCLLLGGLYWQDLMDRRHARGMIEARQLMREINALVENPLPPAVMALSPDSGTANDEDFFKFLIPEEPGKPALSRIGEKGLRT